MSIRRRTIRTWIKGGGFAFLALMLMSGVGKADQPTSLSTEQFHNMLAVCALGLNVHLHANLLGSLTSIYDGSKTNGDATFEITTKFLEQFPETERTNVYALYTNCITHMLGNLNSSAGQEFQEQLLANLKNIIEGKNSRKFDDLADSQGLDTKYPDGYGLFYSDGSKTLHLTKPDRAQYSFDPSGVQVIELTPEKVCMNLPIKMYSVNITMTNACFFRGASGVVHLIQLANGFSLDVVNLSNSANGAAWVLGMGPVTSH